MGRSVSHCRVGRTLGVRVRDSSFSSPRCDSSVQINEDVRALRLVKRVSLPPSSRCRRYALSNVLHSFLPARLASYIALSARLSRSEGAGTSLPE